MTKFWLIPGCPPVIGAPTVACSAILPKLVPCLGVTPDEVLIAIGIRTSCPGGVALMSFKLSSQVSQLWSATKLPTLPFLRVPSLISQGKGILSN